MRIYNSLTLKKEKFVPINEDEVSIYTCGPTVYNYAHIGNLRTYVSEDILVRGLEYLGYNVKRAMNITDVGHLTDDGDEGDDKMLKGAERENKSVYEIADFYTKAFFKDMNRLSLKEPDAVRKATDCIDEFIDFILVLKEKGYTYESGGNVYFDISKVDDYTKLSKMPLENLRVAHREDVSVDDNKKNPFDFVLWFTKSKFENQKLVWDSPFGRGYPGWHLECSVISMSIFGDTLDIHCGGIDHVPTHHTNEIAQSESYTGKKWVNYWWHAEFLIDNNGKMSKSSGDFLNMDKLIELGYKPMHYKYYLLGSHYRRQLSFTFESLDGARDAYKKLKFRIKKLEGEAKETSRYIQEFKDLLSDDLNTPNILTLIYTVLGDDSLENGEKIYILSEIDKVLQLDLFSFERIELAEDLKREVEELIVKRKEAKESKNYEEADRIRDYLSGKGIILVDTKEGTTWKVKE